jgi:hypothetical protein
MENGKMKDNEPRTQKVTIGLLFSTSTGSVREKHWNILHV